MTKEREKVVRESPPTLPPPLTDPFPPLVHHDLPPGFSHSKLPKISPETATIMGYKNSLLNHVSKGRDFDLVREWELESGDVFVDKSKQIPNVTISAKAHSRLAENMRSTAILRLTGKKIGYKSLQFQILKLWQPTSVFHLVELTTNCYMVRFGSEEDHLKALTQGPWLIFGSYLIVQPWTPAFSPDASTVSSLVAWIRLPLLPIHLYHPKVLRAIGESIGHVYKIDQVTSSFDRAKYARFAVGLDLTKPLLPYIIIDGKQQNSQYEGLPKICYRCGSVGHVQTVCPSPENGEKNSEIAIEEPFVSIQNPIEKVNSEVILPKEKKKSPYGPWSQVSRNPKRAVFTEPSQLQAPVKKMGISQGSYGSRFESLAVDDGLNNMVDSCEIQRPKEVLQGDKKRTPVTKVVPIPLARVRGESGISNEDVGKGTKRVKTKSNTILDPSKHSVAVILDDQIHYHNPPLLVGSSSTSIETNKENYSSSMPIKDKRNGIKLSKNLHKTIKIKNSRCQSPLQLSEEVKKAILDESNLVAPCTETVLNYANTDMILCENDGVG